MMMTAQKQKIKCDAQLRLLLPHEWIGELDSLASSHFISRLALIRKYLRKMIDSDLEMHKEHLEQVANRKRVKDQLDYHLSQREDWK